MFGFGKQSGNSGNSGNGNVRNTGTYDNNGQVIYDWDQAADRYATPTRNTPPTTPQHQVNSDRRTNNGGRR